MAQTSTAGIDLIRRTIGALMAVRESPDGTTLSAASADGLPAAIAVLAWGLADWLKNLRVVEPGTGDDAVRYPEYAKVLAEQCRDLARAARQYSHADGG